MRVKIKSPSTGCLGKVRGFFTITVNNPSENVSNRCRVCSFVFIKIKRKRNLKGEFMKIFKEVFNTKFYQTMVFRVQFSTLVAIELKHRGNVIVTGR